MKFKIYIQRTVWFFALLLSSWLSYAQQTAKVGDTTTLSVNEVLKGTYIWELYDYVKDVNFAITKGNCPTNKANFVSSNTKASVQVKWLQSGTYFYKVTINDGCSNNIKIGKIVIEKNNIPPTPKIVVIYNCDEGTATLKATNYTGTLLWSTGETAQTIKVAKKDTYTLVQIINKQHSLPASVSIENAQTPNAPNTSATPTSIVLGESATLMAEGCKDGTLIWYSDKQLTQKVENTTIIPTKNNTYTYYAICKSKAGCKSPYTRVVLTVKPKATCPELLASMEIPRGISPNGDGKNDVWEIEDLKTFCSTCKKEARVVVFNRYGNKVYDHSRYMLDGDRFKGYSKNKLTLSKKDKLPAGTYFYVIEIEGKFVKKGYIYINY